MNGFELVTALNETMAQAEEARLALLDAARKAAEAEAYYRSIIERNIVQLRAEGFPASLIHDMARGRENACQAHIERICAEEEHRMVNEDLLLRKKEIGILGDAVNREWGMTR